MTSNIVKRIKALGAEASLVNLSRRVVFVEPGETGEQALRREGIIADLDDAIVVVIGELQPVKT